MTNEISVTIDGKKVVVAEGTTILQAAKQAGIDIPTLCYHPRLQPAGKCMVCVVKVTGDDMMKTSCTTVCKDGMEVFTNTPEVKAASNKYLHKMLASAPGKQASDFNDSEIDALIRKGNSQLVDESAPALIRDMNLCVGCTRCVRACRDLQGVGMLDLHSDQYPEIGTPGNIPINFTDCIECGQCAAFCPTGAIQERDHIGVTLKAMKEGKVIVLQTAPATRVAIAEMFGKPAGSIGTRKLVGASKAAGFQYVFDTDFTADLTIMEEGTELIQRIKTGGPFPMFTSCCPAWINMVEKLYPEFIPNLSTCRSPQMMMGPLIKTYWAKKMNIDPSRIFQVSMMPCVAKKAEIERQQLWRDGQKDVDSVLTTREFGKLLHMQGIVDWETIAEMDYDNPLGESTGAAVLFANSGGVMEAALRTAYEIITGTPLPKLDLTMVRGLEDTREATVKVGDLDIRVAVVTGGRNIRRLLKKIEESDVKPLYHFVEVMACPGGCIGGGGQPKSLDPEVRQKRMESVWAIDRDMPLRKSHENESVQKLYKEFLGKPLGHVSHELLHTHYNNRSSQVMLPKVEAVSDAHVGGDGAKRVVVMFGSQGGTAAKAAKELSETIKLSVKNAAVTYGSMNSIGTNKLVELAATGKGKDVTDQPVAVFVVATFGDGQMPDNAADMWKELQSDVSLVGLSFVVFGLGSKAYGEAYCKAAADLYARIEKLGATPIMVFNDGCKGNAQATGGHLTTFDPFTIEIAKILGGGVKNVESETPAPLYSVSLAASGRYVLKQPCPNTYHLSTLKTSIMLTDPSYPRPVYMLEFDIKDTGLEYVVGDHVGILPRNNPMTVAVFLKEYGLVGSQVVTIRRTSVEQEETVIPSTLTVQELFEQYMDFQAPPTRKFINAVKLFCTAAREREYIAALLLDDVAFARYVQEHNVGEVLIHMKSADIPLESLISLIPVIKPRLYSIASSSKLNPTVIQLVVVGYNWTTPKQDARSGLCTSYLFRSTVGCKIAVQVHQGILYPPTDSMAPTVLIGLGTGVAPFRGFLQEREALLKDGKKLGPCCFYYACRHHDKDFVLQPELEGWLQSGVLTDLQTAFSHDQKEFITVPVIIGRDPATAYKYISQEGVTLYYCGPAMGIPQSIMKAFTGAIVAEAKILEAEAVKITDKIENEGRWRVESF